MTDDEFWTLIGAAGAATDPTRALAGLLTGRPVDDCIEFDARLHALLRLAWRPELWRLAELALGAVDDASFEYFRIWLVFRGREAFETVLADPDRFADLVADADGHRDGHDFQLDGPQYVAWQVHRIRTGEHMPARRRAPASLLVLGAVAATGDAAEHFPRSWRRLTAPGR